MGKLKNVHKFVRNAITLQSKPKEGDTITSFGAPISSIADIIDVCKMVETKHKVEMEADIVNRLINDYINDKTGKDHLVFNCVKKGNDYHYYGMFISNEQIGWMKDARQHFNEQN